MTEGESMADLHGTLQRFVDDGTLPGAVGVVARGDRTEVAAVGSMAVDGAPMADDSIFRLASITKPITAAAVMMLVEDGRIALDDPVGQWLPELADPKVVRTPASPVEDVVPAARPITVFDLLTMRAGYGFASDFSLPAVQRLFGVQRTAVRCRVSRRRMYGWPSWPRFRCCTSRARRGCMTPAPPCREC
jgi:CubicO group peptidase (beta-lactamase class C family)